MVENLNIGGTLGLLTETISDASTAQPHARETDKGVSLNETMIQSDLHGDVESGSETTRRLTFVVRSSKQQPRQPTVKFVRVYEPCAHEL